MANKPYSQLKRKGAKVRVGETFVEKFQENLAKTIRRYSTKKVHIQDQHTHRSCRAINRLMSQINHYCKGGNWQKAEHRMIQLLSLSESNNPIVAKAAKSGIIDGILPDLRDNADRAPKGAIGCLLGIKSHCSDPEILAFCETIESDCLSTKVRAQVKLDPKDR